MSYNAAMLQWATIQQCLLTLGKPHFSGSETLMNLSRMDCWRNSEKEGGNSSRTTSWCVPTMTTGLLGARACIMDRRSCVRRSLILSLILMIFCRLANDSRPEGCFLNEVLPENRPAVLIRTTICHFKKHHWFIGLVLVRTTDWFSQTPRWFSWEPPQMQVLPENHRSNPGRNNFKKHDGSYEIRD